MKRLIKMLLTLLILSTLISTRTFAEDGRLGFTYNSEENEIEIHRKGIAEYRYIYDYGLGLWSAYYLGVHGKDLVVDWQTIDYKDWYYVEKYSPSIELGEIETDKVIIKYAKFDDNNNIIGDIITEEIEIIKQDGPIVPEDETKESTFPKISITGIPDKVQVGESIEIIIRVDQPCEIRIDGNVYKDTREVKYIVTENGKYRLTAINAEGNITDTDIIIKSFAKEKVGLDDKQLPSTGYKVNKNLIILSASLFMIIGLAIKFNLRRIKNKQ